MNDQRQKILTDFEKDTADHCMTVLVDNGVHRHLRFAKPASSAYSFDIITWPGNLAITGDMGASMFCRTHDMFEFFRGNDDYPTLHINPGYWAEKLTANDGDTKEFDQAGFKALVKDYFNEYVNEHLAEHPERSELARELWEAIQCHVLDDGINSVDVAGCKLEQFGHRIDGKEFIFSDWWERVSCMQNYRHHFIWRLYAIVYAVRCYDAHRQAAAQEEASRRLAECFNNSKIADLERNFQIAMTNAQNAMRAVQIMIEEGDYDEAIKAISSALGEEEEEEEENNEYAVEKL